MRGTQRLFAVISILTLLASLSLAQDPKKQNKQQTVGRTAVSTPVAGSGTSGQIPKWSTSSTIGDSNITEDKSGKVGVGTRTPTSPLTVVGSAVNENGVITATNTNTNGVGIRGIGGSSTPLFLNSSVGVLGQSSAGVGVFASGRVGLSALGGFSDVSSGGDAMHAEGGLSDDGDGGDGVVSFGGIGTGLHQRGGTAIVGIGPPGSEGAADGLAGSFEGDVEIEGTLSATTKLFRIDHPLDPQNRYLSHVSVESPDMKNIYDGNVVTDSNGEAVVSLPDYFEALNRDFRYQLTVIGTFAQAIVAEEIKGNRFVVRTSAANVKVSWQVTGIRQDAWANKNRIKVEVEKSERERGYYLHPDVFNQPEEKSIGWARHPELMQKLKQQRLDAEAKIKKQQQR